MLQVDVLRVIVPPAAMNAPRPPPDAQSSLTSMLLAPSPQPGVVAAVQEREAGIGMPLAAVLAAVSGSALLLTAGEGTCLVFTQLRRLCCSACGIFR